MKAIALMAAPQARLPISPPPPAAMQRTPSRWMIQNADHSKILGNSNICSDIGKVMFPGTGHYTLSVYSSDASTGNYRVSWEASGDNKMN